MATSKPKMVGNWKDEEIWIPSEHEHYMVSTMGRVFSIPRKINMPKDRRRGSWVYSHKGGLLKPKASGSGYRNVALRIKQHKYKHVLIHRLVAKAFLANPQGKQQVNHKNGDRADNRLANLEWNTHSENLSWRFTVRNKYCARCRAELQ